MRLSQLDMVNRHAAAVKRIDEQLAAVELGYVHVVIGSSQMDEALTAIVRPVLERELKARKAELQRDMADLGVEVD